jgi:hypothetical protein
MTERQKNDNENENEVESDEREDSVVRDLLKRTMSADAIERNAPDLLQGVQRRIRRRSRGKFFGDGWSTGQARIGYVLVALVTLLLVAIAYYALGPMDVR